MRFSSGIHSTVMAEATYQGEPTVYLFHDPFIVPGPGSTWKLKHESIQSCSLVWGLAARLMTPCGSHGRGRDGDVSVPGVTPTWNPARRQQLLHLLGQVGVRTAVSVN